MKFWKVYQARDVGVNSVVLFPEIPDALKTPTGDEAYNDNGLVPRAIRLLKDKCPDIVIYTDVALDPYSSDGHDGIARDDAQLPAQRCPTLVWKMSEPLNRSRWEQVAPSNLDLTWEAEFEIQRPKPHCGEILSVVLDVLNAKGATSMERAKLSEEITFSVRRLSGYNEDSVNEVLATCHKYKREHLEGRKIAKGKDTNGREWIWLEA